MSIVKRLLKVVFVLVLVLVIVGTAYLASQSTPVTAPSLSISLATSQSITLQTASSDMVVNAGPLNVRSGPGTEYDVIGTLYRGDNVRVRSVDGDWCKIDYKDKDAYVSCRFLVSK
jgi:uncharacterized protein YraI